MTAYDKQDDNQPAAPDYTFVGILALWAICWAVPYIEGVFSWTQ